MAGFQAKSTGRGSPRLYVEHQPTCRRSTPKQFQLIDARARRYRHEMGVPLTRREQLLVARIIRQRLTREQMEPLLLSLAPNQRASVLEAVAAVSRWKVPRRRRRTTIGGKRRPG